MARDVRERETIPPPPPESKAFRRTVSGIRAQADKLEEFAQRIMSRVEELRESADRQEGIR